MDAKVVQFSDYVKKRKSTPIRRLLSYFKKLKKSGAFTGRSIAFLIFFVAMACLISGCKAPKGRGDKLLGREITVGFAQVGHESDWRIASTNSVKQALSEENGIKLDFIDCDNDIDVQIKAVSGFVDKKVDYIVIDPIVSTGWEEVLTKAEEAGIPVIVIDRTIDDSEKYVTWLGSEFTDEGLAAGEWLKNYAAKKGLKEINIIEVTGNEGSSAENGRSAGFHKYIEYEAWNIIDSWDGEFTEEGGKRVMDEFCEEYKGEFNVIVAQNDNMAFGIMKSLDEHGISYGVGGDMIIISFDACKNGLKNVLDGNINADFECNPLQGPACLKLIYDLEKQAKIQKETFMSETWYAAEDIVPEITYFNSMGEEVTEPIVVVDKAAVEAAY
ncbi:ABC transporter substrate-binding protein [Butyrivibrio sp. INlla16]|uniref:ABC transporter substrate-binding protein n=1 Tax=Butyrivibrio sp. INlla16 TaxID=1520807 RepID=UPI00087EF280|nr:ABC transporter substrate-binding protein [Butyrivibrio sp. INlla16]SDB19033.1 simple sugar transport system substrate-binding protein [Butyrivibrio sp. INlla16]